MRIKPLDSAYQKTLPQKYQAHICKIWNFVFFVKINIKDAYLLYFFPRGDHVETMVL